MNRSQNRLFLVQFSRFAPHKTKQKTKNKKTKQKQKTKNKKRKKQQQQIITVIKGQNIWFFSFFFCYLEFA